MRSTAVLTGVVLGVLCLAAAPHPVLAAKEEPRLSVIYEPPKLTVEARGVNAVQVLQAIGAKVGFRVVDPGLARPAITLSIRGASLDDVLRTLLRAENYVLVYRKDDRGKKAPIETIVLLGSAPSGGASPDVGTGQQAQSGHVIHSYNPPRLEQSRAPLPVPTPPADQGGTRGQIGEEIAPSPKAPGPRVNATNPRVAGAQAGAHQPIPAGAPDPALVQDQILQHVRAMVDAVRRATLDVPRGR